jgi:hypothetical protein
LGISLLAVRERLIAGLESGEIIVGGTLKPRGVIDMEKKFITGMLAMALAFGMMACEQGTSGGDGGGDSVVYRSETAQGLMVLTITKAKATGNSNILGNAYGSPVYAYMPQNGDEYTITLAGVPVSSGKVTVDKTSAKMTFTVADTKATFEASITSTGGSLTFTAGIKTNAGIPDITIKIEVETTTPPFIETPITPPTTNPPTTNPPAYTPPVYIPPPVDSGEQVYYDDEQRTPATELNGTVKLRYYYNESYGSDTPGYDDVTIGSVTNGKLKFTLPSTAPSQHLQEITGMPSNVIVSQPNARTASPIFLFADGTQQRSLNLMKTVGGTEHSAGYFYFDQACSITGTERVTNEYDGSVYTSIYSVNASAGWNKIYQYQTQSGSTYEITITTSNVPSDLKWVVSGGGVDVPGDTDTTPIPAGKVSAPIAYPSAGAVPSGTAITLSTTTSGASIYYTLNGETPTVYSTPYDGGTQPVITAAATLKAIAVKDGMGDSDVLTAIYTIGDGDSTYRIILSANAYDFPTEVVNYGEQDALEITVTNDGDQPTGDLTVSASADFEITAPANGIIDSIPIGGEAAFRVRPRTGLPVGPHNGTVTVGNANVLSVTFSASFTVYAPIDPESGFTSISDAIAYLNYQSGGATVAAPVPLKLNVSIDTDSLQSLWTALGTAGKFVALDLSSCSMSGTEFDPGAANTGKDNIVTLVLPDTSTSIKSETGSNPAFTGFTSLQTVHGENVTSNGNGAFANCTSLTTADFPVATTIGDRAFAGCTYLSTVSLPNATSMGGYAFATCASLTTVSFPKVTSIGTFAFNYCTSLTTVSFPDATNIGTNLAGSTFNGCTSLTTVFFPKVTTIERNAFTGCTSLTSVTFPLVTSIGGLAFRYCESLTTASFPKATSIGDWAFDGCTSLTTAYFPEATTIEDSAFEGTALTEVSFPKVTTIEINAFRYCESLTTVSLPKATDIGGGAFEGCIALTSPSFPETTSIGLRAFYGCTALATVSVPKVTAITAQAFSTSGTGALTITMGNTAPTVGTNMFKDVTGTKNVTVRVPNSATGYTSTWQSNFKGENSYINLVIQYY